MSTTSEIENLVKVKRSLADKYIRLARARKSKPAKLRLYRHAEHFRQQATTLSRGLSL
ncbi:MAG: hypothetical protein H6822_19130 [Planctomycetaceae bacterium]|nr:hypothetical protein [Planctomycetales bacterium]MCB9924301.1 hypothetical protein [Planctomycetaceae bacterium]